MNDRYLFRGRRYDNGEWITGWITSQFKKFTEGEVLTYIQSNVFGGGEHLVNTKTVGQYTGLKDKNGKPIFEGDIVLASSQKWRCAVVFDNVNARFICHTNDKPCRLVYVSMQYKDNTSALEVIGNIHDNPELLQRSDEE